MRTDRMPEVPMFGLTGGMGAGKSTAGKIFAELGAAVIDADEVVRDLNRPGEPGFNVMVDMLGEGVIGEDGRLDTAKVSSTIFAVPEIKREIEQIIHPLVWANMFAQVRELEEDDIPILEVPLLKPEHTRLFSGVIVVNTERELAIQRLADRGFSREEAEARINTQMTNEERAEMADRVIDNNGTYDELVLLVDGAWRWARETDAQTRQPTRPEPVT